MKLTKTCIRILALLCQSASYYSYSQTREIVVVYDYEKKNLYLTFLFLVRLTVISAEAFVMILFSKFDSNIFFWTGVGEVL